MKLKDFVDIKMLQDIQDQFSHATGMAAIAVDEKGNYITQGSNFTDFCMKYTRQTPEGARRCVKCDTECKGTYFCHAGLMDFASDIIVDGKKLGAIIGGQVLPEEPDLEKFARIARELGIDEREYIDALKKVPIKTEKSIRQAAAMLENIVNLLANQEYLKQINKKKIEVYDTEVANAFASIKDIKAKMRDLKSIAVMENMLSVNASIEAAHAREAGVGFSIVVKEIGELSKKSSSVYGEIETSVKAIEESVHKMNHVQL